jgi:hypothetical protein
MDHETDRAATHPNPAVRLARAERGSYDGKKPLHEIEEDIACTRSRMNAAVDALEQELTPRRVIENGAEVLRKALEPRPGPFRDQVRAYAIPLALIAAGLGWLFVLRSRSRQTDLSDNLRGTADDVAKADERPSPAPLHAGVMGQMEPVSLVDESAPI